MASDALEQLDALLRLFRQYGLEELIVEEGGMKVHLSARRDGAPSPPAPAIVRRQASDRASGPRRGPGRTVAVRSPLIGTFYRAPSPDAPPFVELGDVVEEGQTVCIVEAMKVFNEIKAEWRGRVVAIPAEDGKLVQAGEPLVVLEFLPEGREEGA